jgi:hypothetical protein
MKYESITANLALVLKKDRVKLSQHSHSSTGQPQDQEPKSLTPIAKSNNKLLKKSQPHPQQEY